MGPEHNDFDCVYNSLRDIFLDENLFILIQISLNVVPGFSTDKTSMSQNTRQAII